MADRQISPIAKDLMAAKAKIANPENWCRKVFYNPMGNKRCAVGALISDDAMANKAIHEKLAPIERTVDVLKASCYALYGTHNIYEINDDWGHEHVMAVYDNAINRAIREKM